MAGKDSVFQPGHAVAGQVGEPGGSIGRDRQPSEARDRCIEYKPCDIAATAHARNGARGEVRVPGAAVGCDGEPERLDVAIRRGQPLDAAVAHSANRIGMVDGEPDAAVDARCNRDRRILRLAHAVLDEFFLRDGAHEQKRASCQNRDAKHRGQCSNSEVRKSSRRTPYEFRNRQGHWSLHNSDTAPEPEVLNRSHRAIRVVGTGGHARINVANRRRRVCATGDAPQDRRRSAPAHKTIARRRD